MRLISVTIVAIVGITLSASLVLLVIPSMLPSHLQQDTSNRIALAQLSVETASVFALLLAAWEFYQAQRKPKLRVLAQLVEESFREPIGEPLQVISQPRPLSEHWTFHFRLLLDNYGDAPAHWVKLALSLDRSDSGYGFQRISAEHPSGKWVPDQIYSHSTWYVFHAGDDFISYNRPREVASLTQWLEPLGVFQLTMPVTQKNLKTKVSASLIFSIQADGFADLNQVLRFQID